MKRLISRLILLAVIFSLINTGVAGALMKPLDGTQIGVSMAEESSKGGPTVEEPEVTDGVEGINTHLDMEMVGPPTRSLTPPDLPVKIDGVPGPSAGPLTATVTFSELPLLNKPVVVTAKFLLDSNYIRGGKGIFRAKNVNVSITIPEGFELVNKPSDVQLDNNARVWQSGRGVYKVGRALKWKGEFTQGIPFEIKATIRAVRTGDFEIEAKAGWIPEPHRVTTWVGRQVLYISTSKDKAEVSNRRPVRFVLPSKKGPLFPVKSTSVTFINPLTITGYIECYVSSNSLPGPFEIRDDVKVPMVWGGVFIYNSRTMDPIGFTETSGNPDPGKFSITIENPYPDGIRIGVKPQSPGRAVVLQGDTSQYEWLYAPTWTVPLGINQLNVPDQELEIDWDNYLDFRSAFRIYETITNDVWNRGAQFFLQYASEGPHYQPPIVTVYYPSATGDIFYDPLDKVIHVANEDHTRALDMVQHEYGHRVMHKLYNDGQFPGIDFRDPNHQIFSKTNTSAAFGEGWADFFPLVVQKEAIYEYGNGNQLGLDDPTWNSPGWDIGEDVEGRVAGALWDIIDRNNSQYVWVDDDYSNNTFAFANGPFMSIWEQLIVNPANFDNYWIGWVTTNVGNPELNNSNRWRDYVAWTMVHRNTIDFPYWFYNPIDNKVFNPKTGEYHEPALSIVQLPHNPTYSFVVHNPIVSMGHDSFFSLEWDQANQRMHDNSLSKWHDSNHSMYTHQPNISWGRHVSSISMGHTPEISLGHNAFLSTGHDPNTSWVHDKMYSRWHDPNVSQAHVPIHSRPNNVLRYFGHDTFFSARHDSATSWAHDGALSKYHNPTQSSGGSHATDISTGHDPFLSSQHDPKTTWTHDGMYSDWHDPNISLGSHTTPISLNHNWFHSAQHDPITTWSHDGNLSNWHNPTQSSGNTHSPEVSTGHTIDASRLHNPVDSRN